MAISIATSCSAPGDAINAVLAAVGHNLRLLWRWLARLLAFLLAALTMPPTTENLRPNRTRT